MFETLYCTQSLGIACTGERVAVNGHCKTYVRRVSKEQLENIEHSVAHIFPSLIHNGVHKSNAPVSTVH